MERTLWWDAFGCNIDPGTLPARDYEAHLAILEGRSLKAKEEHEKAEAAAKKAGRGRR